MINPADFKLFFSELAKNRPALLILDYDGTLAPFQQNPQHASPYPGVRDRIQKIMQLEKTRIVIMSGRGLSELRALLYLDPSPELWGSHGGERLQKNAINQSIIQVDPIIQDLMKEAALHARALAPELYCEIKPLSVALHWRGKDPEKTREGCLQVLEDWEKIISGYALDIHKFDGGIELRPRGMNKGEAVKTLLQEIPSNTLIAYLGDDATDEDAFEILGTRALKILVRPEIRPTRADTHLTPPQELLWFLDRWIESQT